jgi:hypothetical protein
MRSVAYISRIESNGFSSAVLSLLLLTSAEGELADSLSSAETMVRRRS